MPTPSTKIYLTESHVLEVGSRLDEPGEDFGYSCQFHVADDAVYKVLLGQQEVNHFAAWSRTENGEDSVKEARSNWKQKILLKDGIEAIEDFGVWGDGVLDDDVVCGQNLGGELG